MQQWYYSRGGQTFGPFALAELRKKVSDGSLHPDDLVAQAGMAAWVRARTVPGLFSTPSAVTAVPTARPTLRAAAPAKPAVRAAEPVPVPSSEPAGAGLIASLFLMLPKPLLFGLFGGIGGLVGAVFIGELAWFVLSPPRLREPEPSVRIAIPDSMRLYAGDKNYFVAQVARDHFEGPITIVAVNPPEGLTVAPVQVQPGIDQASVEVAANATLAPGKHTLRFRGSGPEGSKALADFATLEVNVETPPASLRIAAPPKLTLYAAGKGRFTVRVGRTNFNQPITLTLGKLPAGATAPPVEVNADEATIEVSAVAGLAPGTSPIQVAAQSNLPSGPLTATVDMQLEVLAMPVPKADIIFVLDLTSSMQFAINGVKDGIQNFARQLERRNLDARIGMVCFRDIEDDRERPFVLTINGEALTRDFATFRTEVGKQKARGGGDDPESSLQGLALAAEQPFRPDAAKVLLLITDALPKLHPNEKVRTIDDAIAELKRNHIDQLHLVVHQGDFREAYGQIHKVFKGTFFDLNRAKDSAAFVKILPELSEEISRITTAVPPSAPEARKPLPLPSVSAEPLAPAVAVAALKGVQSTETYSAADTLRLLFAIAFWTMIIATAISLLILAGQALYARQGLMTLSEAARGLAGGVIAGLVGGIVGQLFFQVTAGGVVFEILSRLVGWTLLGGLIGLGMAFFIPNLKWYRGIAGGVLGGFLGALAFVAVSRTGSAVAPQFGAILGRCIGAAILGFCIGLMIALAELVFRRWWLEISFSPREVRTVTLGSAAVTVGGNERQVSVFVPGAPAVALRFRVDDDRVVCEDAVAGRSAEMHPGDQRMLGKVRVTLCSAAHAKKIGYRLHLSSGRSVALTEGLPLTAEDLPGLEAAGKDGIVALIATRPNDPGTLLLRNRSAQTWSAESRDGIFEMVEPTRSIAVADGMRISFGSIKGSLRRNEGAG